MLIDTALKIFKEYESKIWALSAASGIIYHDGNTVAPSQSYKPRGMIMAALSEQVYTLSTSEEFINALKAIDAHGEQADAKTLRAAQLYLKDALKMQKIPMDEYVEYSRHISESSEVWHTAKETDDFELFAPYLQKTVDTLIKFSQYTDPEKDVYDNQLDDYESGLTKEGCDRFFGYIKPVIIDLVKKIKAAQPPKTDFMKEYFPVSKQKALAQKINDLMLIDAERFTVAETEHPYTTDASKYDVRVATHYHENDFGSALFSNVHENGHALYELGTADDYAYSVLGGGVSMGIHESQSRFYENIIGHSLPFAKVLHPMLKELAPAQFRNITAEDLWKALCESKPSLVRTEADELTYCMHIIIRYELEDKLLHRDITVKELPDEWNRLYKEYLGVDVPDNKSGVLQDSHWSGGMLGYFPSYALGSAYGAQMLAKMKETVDVDTAIESGNFAPVNAWLEQNIWRHGRMYEPSKLLKDACGEEFDPKYFADYLTDKYTKLYNL